MDSLFCPSALVWGDVATWLAAMATVAATGVALWLGVAPAVNERRERLKRMTLRVWMLAEEINLTLTTCDRIANKMTDKDFEEAAESQAGAVRLEEKTRNASLPLVSSDVLVLLDFPEDSGYRIASVLGEVSIMRRYLVDATKYVRAEDRRFAYEQVRKAAQKIFEQLTTANELLKVVMKESVKLFPDAASALTQAANKKGNE